MKAYIKNSSIKGEVNSIPSKSYAHRALICNFLSGNKGNIEGLYPSEDITATKNCIDALINAGEKVTLDCGESGSTFRFMIPVAMAIGGEFVFIGRGRLMERPIEELTSVLEKHGVVFNKSDYLLAKGKLTPGEYKIRGDISSQYVTGLLTALPLLNGDSEIILTTPLASKPYVDITLSVLADYGIEITQTENGFNIKGNQKYKAKDYIVEGDWSNAGYHLVLGALSTEGVTLKNINVNSLQADKSILSVIESAGGKIITEGNQITIKNTGKLKAFAFNAKHSPDVVPAISALASFCEGESVITDIERLKIKESDRVLSIITTLKTFGIKAREENNSLIITGGTVKGGNVYSFNDHRIVMMASILALNAKGKSVIEGADAVNKSYPTFFEDLKKLGGEVKIEI